VRCNTSSITCAYWNVRTPNYNQSRHFRETWV